MFSKFFGSKNKSSPTKLQNDTDDSKTLPERHPYTRPKFVHLSEEDGTVFSSHDHRTILTSSSSDDSKHKLPSSAGYAECINGGKSPKNEDQASAGTFVLIPQTPDGDSDQRDPIDVSYFCIFDGHAGPGAAMMAADELILYVKEKLMEVVDYLLTLNANDIFSNSVHHYDVTVDSLVKGAIEEAYLSFDNQIATERKTYHISGGCTAIMALVLLNRLYVAHAGDCRAVAYIGDEIVELSQEFTPETDAQRIQTLAHANPSLMHGVFSANCYHRPLMKKDIGTRILYRPPMSSGWFSKTLTKEDVESPPLVAGRGKWARLMGVIGVTRGFGDHDLTVPSTSLIVKPFMTAMPEICVFDLGSHDFKDDDVLVMGCDGLWDFIINESMQTAVKASMTRVKEENNNSICYTAVAKDVVHFSRGDNHGKGWKMADGRDASFDDICAFVIPLLHLRNSHKISDKKELPVTADLDAPPASTEINQKMGESSDSIDISEYVEVGENGNADKEERVETNGNTDGETNGNTNVETVGNSDVETNGNSDSVATTP